MTVRSFVDTNVFAYVLDDAEPAKQAQARAALAAPAPGALVISTQVLGELYVVATRKLGVDPDAAAAFVDDLADLPVVPIEAALVKSAIATSRSATISYWDALIVEAAASAGCERVLTEDLADGMSIGSVRIESPFRPADPRHSA